MIKHDQNASPVAGHVVRVTRADGQHELYDVAIAEPSEAEAMIAAALQATNERIEVIETIPRSVLDGLMLPAGSFRKRPPRWHLASNPCSVEFAQCTCHRHGETGRA